MKTQMKTIATKISAILLAGVSMAGLQSCDYLDIEPEKTLPGESVDYTRTEGVSFTHLTLPTNSLV